MVEKPIGPVQVQGFSMAGEETVVILPEMNLAFDVGRAPRELISIDYVFLTHGHMDHSAGLAYYFSQRNFQGLAPGTLVCHHSLVAPINDLLAVYARIEGHLSPAKVVGVDEDEDVTVRRDLVVRPFRVAHRQMALGFSAVEVRKKLKPEYAEYSGQQIAEIKRTGVDVEYRLEIPRVAFCGDSAFGRYLDLPHVTNAEVLIIECTFFEEGHLERARAGLHTHVRDLPRIYERVSSPQVVISHTTRRTGLAEVRRCIEQVLGPGDLARTTILMERPPRRGPR